DRGEGEERGEVAAHGVWVKVCEF
ncbi:MAG: hypothetical protein JWM74_1016, partial [Myxococcaceae bacterium]|nr:hypothetical protein [Myxococcaceae bacterium]